MITHLTTLTIAHRTGKLKPSVIHFHAKWISSATFEQTTLIHIVVNSDIQATDFRYFDLIYDRLS
jgi:hypothetical protein